MKKMASIYLRNNMLMFDSLSKTTDGLWMGSETIISTLHTDTDKNKGLLVAKALSISKQGIPHPKTWDDSQIKPLLQLAKVKSYSTFIKGTTYCTVEEENQFLTYVPTANLGNKGGFVPITDLIVKIPSNSPPEKVGEALMKALSLSR